MDPIEKKARYQGEVAGGGMRHGKGRYEYPHGAHGLFTYAGFNTYSFLIVDLTNVIIDRIFFNV